MPIPHDAEWYERNEQFFRFRAEPCPTCGEFTSGLYIRPRDGEYDECPNTAWHEGLLRDAQAFYARYDAAVLRSTGRQDEGPFGDWSEDALHFQQQLLAGLRLPRRQAANDQAPLAWETPLVWDTQRAQALRTFVEGWDRRGRPELTEEEVDWLLIGIRHSGIREPWRTPAAHEVLEAVAGSPLRRVLGDRQVEVRDPHSDILGISAPEIRDAWAKAAQVKAPAKTEPPPSNAWQRLLKDDPFE